MKRILFVLFMLAAATAKGQFGQFDHHATANAGHANGLPASAFVGPYSGTPVLGDMIVFNGTNWVSIAAGTNGQVLTENTNLIPTWQAAAGGGAPTTATYLLQTANGSLPNAQAMGALGTGIVINTTTTGVQSILSAQTCTNQFVRSYTASGTATCSSILTADITAANVTLPKIQNATANSRFLGSGSAGSGASYAELSSSTLVFGASSVDATLTTTNDGGAIIKQASSPGTQQGSSGSANINFNGTEIEELDAIAAAQTDGVILQNTTAATAGATVQNSPILKLCGTAWNTNGPGPSETDCWRIQNLTGSANPSTQTLRFLSSIAGGAYTAPFILTQAGAATFTGSMTLSAQQLSISGGGSAPLITETGDVAGTGGLNMTSQNSGSSLLTVKRLISVSCTSGTTCDSTANIPANFVVLSLTYRITTAVTGATTIELGTATNATAFCTGLTTLTVNTTGVCSGGSTAGAGVNGSAVALRATATAGTYTAGVIEYEITGIIATPPTS